VTRDFVGCATLKRYYAQLHLMYGRFPMGEGGEAAVAFTWSVLLAVLYYFLNFITLKLPFGMLFSEQQKNIDILTSSLAKCNVYLKKDRN
jgi:hypothetical protein